MSPARRRQRAAPDCPRRRTPRSPLPSIEITQGGLHMAFTYSRVILVGRAGATPELRALPGGQSVVTLSLATDRPGQPGTPSATDWHRVTCYERLADIAAQRITPGQL